MIPAEIWETDKALITSWLKSRPKISRDNHRIITDFYLFTQRSILKVGERDLQEYHKLLLQENSENTANTYIRRIRRFFNYSRESNGNIGDCPSE